MKKRHDLLSKMKDYKYGNYKMDNLKFNKMGEFIEISGFFLGEGKMGVCNEQNSYFAKENSDLGLVKVKGTEPKYFREKNDTHYFLVKPLKKLPKDFYSLSSDIQKDVLNNSDPYVVDASFKVVDSLEKSKYTINSIVEDFPLFDDVILSNGKINPIGIKSSGELLYIGMNNDEVRVFTQDKGSSDISEGVPLEKLSRLGSIVKGDQELGIVISKLSNAYIDYKLSK